MKPCGTLSKFAVATCLWLCFPACGGKSSSDESSADKFSSAGGHPESTSAGGYGAGGTSASGLSSTAGGDNTGGVSTGNVGPSTGGNSTGGLRSDSARGARRSTHTPARRLHCSAAGRIRLELVYLWTRAHARMCRLSLPYLAQLTSQPWA